MTISGGQVKVGTEHEHKGEGRQERVEKYNRGQITNDLYFSSVKTKHNQHVADEQPDGNAQTDLITIGFHLELVLLHGEGISVVL